MNFPMNIEQWRLISGYDIYEVSSHGRVRNNTNGRMLKLHTNNDGYRYVGLYKQKKTSSRRVHRLVAFAFLDKNNEHTEVDHIDHNKINNMVDNLRWTTKSENQRNRSIQNNSSSGTTGVNFHKSDNSWCARWNDNNMKRQSKKFSVNKYGDEKAKQLAINYRKERAQENGYLNI